MSGNHFVLMNINNHVLFCKLILTACFESISGQVCPKHEKIRLNMKPALNYTEFNRLISSQFLLIYITLEIY